MVALEVAALREVQSDEIGLKVIDRPAVVRCRNRGWRSKELRDLLLNAPERTSQRRSIEDWKRFTHARMLQL
jgi:hypothetical protein